jgi:hypothetical protein
LLESSSSDTHLERGTLNVEPPPKRRQPPWQK